MDEEGAREIKNNFAKPPLMERTGAKRKRDSAQHQVGSQLPLAASTRTAAGPIACSATAGAERRIFLRIENQPIEKQIRDLS